MTVRMALVAAAAVALIALAAFFGEAFVLGPRVQTVTVTPRDLVRSGVASGRVEAPHRVDIGSQIVGTVVRVPVDEGQMVKAGEALATLEY